MALTYSDRLRLHAILWFGNGRGAEKKMREIGPIVWKMREAAIRQAQEKAGDP